VGTVTSSLERRIVAGGLLLAGGLVALWLLWGYIVGAAVLFAAFRVLTRGTRSRRPKSSWSSLGRTAALMFAAWNSRWLKPSLVKASIPAKAGAEHAPRLFDDTEPELEGAPF
jgi:hypothetical protein